MVNNYSQFSHYGFLKSREARLDVISAIEKNIDSGVVEHAAPFKSEAEALKELRLHSFREYYEHGSNLDGIPSYRFDETRGLLTAKVSEISNAPSTYVAMWKSAVEHFRSPVRMPLDRGSGFMVFELSKLVFLGMSPKPWILLKPYRQNRQGPHRSLLVTVPVRSRFAPARPD